MCSGICSPVNTCSQKDIMDPSTSCTCLFLLLALSSEVEPSTDLYIDGSAVEDGPPNPELPYLWFGPRLGRRKRTSEEKNPLEESVISVFEDTPWALVPLKNYQDHTMMSFHPHMVGREVEEVTENSKAPPFAPRLGRTRKLLPFSPRLGREMIPESRDRFERSTSEELKTH